MKRAKARKTVRLVAGKPDHSLAQQVGEALKAHGMMLATAESCTGGGIAQAITAVSGSSSWFDRGFVTYSNESKEEMLGVSPETLEEHGAVSEQTVREMVSGALEYSRAGVALSVSGIAGPTGGSPEKPVGTVWFAWASRDEVRSERHQLSGDRDGIRADSVRIALHGVINLLNDMTKTA